jgi:hypothetical protein
MPAGESGSGAGNSLAQPIASRAFADMFADIWENY